jgi:L-threonylcarbamoyladenylate synthase
MYLKINPLAVSQEELSVIVNSLLAGNFIAYPTDTIYGLGCLATNRKALSEIKKFKQRDKQKPLIILVSSLNMVKKYCFVSKNQVEKIRNFLDSDRPTTIILRHRGLLPSELTGGKDTLAWRLPKSIFLRKMIRTIGLPIVSTSFNISGQSVINRVDNLKEVKIPNLIIDGGVLKNKASQIIDLSSGEVVVVRK